MSQTSETAAAAALATPAKHGPERPFRVKLRGSILALIRLPNRRELRSNLHQLSSSGGLVQLDKPLDEKLEVELIFHVAESTVREKVQMLFPMWATQGWLQPFRFVDMPEERKTSLETNLNALVKRLRKPASER
jgi:hypothetical protein